MAGVSSEALPAAPDLKIESVLQELRMPARLLDELIAKHVERSPRNELFGRASKLLWEL